MKYMSWDHDDHEGRDLSPEGSGPKVFGGAMCNAITLGVSERLSHHQVRRQNKPQHVAGDYCLT
jgi:hypothetical protein